jgi:hypothetical protein
MLGEDIPNIHVEVDVIPFKAIPVIHDTTAVMLLIVVPRWLVISTPR